MIILNNGLLDEPCDISKGSCLARICDYNTLAYDLKIHGKILATPAKIN
ncbi:hypothetical protein [Bathymodiolus platifrons methanotrophic gill symbiont]|nr:hypothetical protein [Bathymodiolus platifrons methanotrophic gill symbiont]